LDIPPEVALKATIRPGSVYYFPKERFSSKEPHYFVVINIDPTTDEVIFVVCSSSQIEKVKQRNKHKHNPPETLVIVSKKEYVDFTCDSIIDCNNVFPERIQTLVEKLSKNTLKIKTEMNKDIVIKLRKATWSSPQVAFDTKMKLGMKIPD
jgi:hypothetical protein